MEKVRFYKSKDKKIYVMVMFFDKAIFASQIIHERHIKSKAELSAYEMDFIYMKDIIGNYVPVTDQEILGKFIDFDVKKLAFKLHDARPNGLEFSKLTIDIKYY